MLTISPRQFDSFAQVCELRYRSQLAHELRRDLGAYVVDLSDPELDQFAETLCDEARSLGFSTEYEIASFARPCVVYGALSHRDPLFEPMYYASLPGAGARRRLGPAALSAATAKVLQTEFARRSGTQLVADLAAVFLSGAHPEPGPYTAIELYFPERAARLAPGALEAHLALASVEADRLGLVDLQARHVHGDVAQLLGACFARDPLYPWAIAAFAGADSDTGRIARLRTALKVIARKASLGR